MPTVFISHASADRQFVATELLELLRSHGIAPWYAEAHIQSATAWERTILKALRDSEWFLVVMSQEALQSEWVRTETHWACENRTGRIVPVMIQDVDPAELHLKLARLQYVDYRRDPEPARHALLATWGIPYTGDANKRPPLQTHVEQLSSGTVAVSAESGSGSGALRAGRYVVENQIAVGGAAKIFMARDTVLNRRVVLKVAHSPTSGDAFAREASIAAQLRHPAIVTWYDFGRDENGKAYAVQEYIESKTLGKLHSSGRLSFSDSVRVLIDVAEALDFGHHKGFLHLDLNLDNILVDDTGHAHVLDFGVIPVGMAGGRMAYMAPETLNGGAIGVTH